MRKLLEAFDRWRAMSQAVDQMELAGTVLDESGYTEMWQKNKAPDAPGRLENLKELVSALKEFESLEGFLEHISLVMDRDDGTAGEMASLMTLHAAKGLEFDHVFLPGWEEEVFPNRRSVDDGGSAALEEERSLPMSVLPVRGDGCGSATHPAVRCMASGFPVRRPALSMNYRMNSLSM